MWFCHFWLAFWFVLYTMGSPWLSNKQGDLGIGMEGTGLEYSWITMLISDEVVSVLPCLTLPFSCWMLVGWKEHQRLESHAHARLARRAISLPVWNRQSGFPVVIIPIGFDRIRTQSANGWKVGRCSLRCKMVQIDKQGEIIRSTVVSCKRRSDHGQAISESWI